MEFYNFNLIRKQKTVNDKHSSFFQQHWWHRKQSFTTLTWLVNTKLSMTNTLAFSQQHRRLRKQSFTTLTWLVNTKLVMTNTIAFLQQHRWQRKRSFTDLIWIVNTKLSTTNTLTLLKQRRWQRKLSFTTLTWLVNTKLSMTNTLGFSLASVTNKAEFYNFNLTRKHKTVNANTLTFLKQHRQHRKQSFTALTWIVNTKLSMTNTLAFSSSKQFYKFNTSTFLTQIFFSSKKRLVLIPGSAASNWRSNKTLFCLFVFRHFSGDCATYDSATRVLEKGGGL
jgi:hypothetical protein